MKVCKNISPASMCCGLETVVTLGMFDGVHAGHRKIVEDIIAIAETKNCQSAVITFDRHPVSVINPDKAPMLLTTLEEKLDLIENLGVDIAYVISFSKEVAAMSAADFVSNYLIDCRGMKTFVVGYDHGFGKNREGSSDSLDSLALQYDFDLQIKKPIEIDGNIVNSSAIRALIAKGDLGKASSMLVRDHSLSGSVVHGHGVGKTIGFPTANIDTIDTQKIIPREGVYKGWLIVNEKKHDAVISIGPRLTYNDFESLIEAHILNFSEDIYDAQVELGFMLRIRDIVKFETEGELVKQIEKDIEEVNNRILYTNT